MQTVYADVSFIINFCMDYIILWSCGRITHGHIRHRRLALAAGLGALYAVGQLYMGGAIYQLPGKLLFSVLMVWVALGASSRTGFIRQLLCFYAISLLAGGLSVAGAYLSLEAGWMEAWLPLGVMLALLSAWLIGVGGERWLFNKMTPIMLNYAIRIQIGDHCCQGAAFLDTGNGLLDPLSRQPVVVAEYHWLREYLPRELEDMMRQPEDLERVVQTLGDSVWASRLRMIPFSSVGRRHGLLVGLRCDCLTIGSGKKQISHPNMVVALYPERLSADNTYQALIPSGILLTHSPQDRRKKRDMDQSTDIA